MEFRKQGLWMGGDKANANNTEFVNKHASADRIRALRLAVSAASAASP
jgi:hypothetical protein